MLKLAIAVILTILLILLTTVCAVLWKKQKRPEEVRQGYIVIPCNEGTVQLELTVRSAYWGEMLESCDRRRTILIVTDDAGENEFTARRLEAELPGVETVDISALKDRILRDRV